MNQPIRSMGLVVSTALFVTSQTGCVEDDVPDVLTGKLELALEASPTPLTSEVAEGPAQRLIIRTTGWRADELLVGRCAGACDEAEVDAWLTSRADALYGVKYGCPDGEACITDPDQWGFEELRYGSCPANVHSMLHPTNVEPSLGLVDDTAIATDCNALAPAVDDGAIYYVTALGFECSNHDFDDCHEVRGVRFFQVQSGQLVDISGTNDDRRPVHFASTDASP